MPLTLQDWRRRYSQQAGWTRSLRDYLFRRLRLGQNSSILEAGCGTGAILTELDQRGQEVIYGIDINQEALRLAAQQVQGARFACADGLRLPFAPGSLDLTLCHFYLLWVADPVQALREMKRVTRPGGAVLALAEPDYGGRIDYPPELEALGAWQQEALRRQGADPRLGRKLRGLFTAAGLEIVESGVLGGQWPANLSLEEADSEWAVLHSDLAGQPGVSAADLGRLYEKDKTARLNGERVLFTPTFYLWGSVR